MAHVDGFVAGPTVSVKGRSIKRKFAWGRLFALGATVALWVGLHAAGKGLLHFLN